VARYRKPLVNGDAEDVHGAAADSSPIDGAAAQEGLVFRITTISRVLAGLR